MYLLLIPFLLYLSNQPKKWCQCFGFEKDPDFGFPIDRENADFTLTYYDQENEQATGQYAPARWTLIVQLAFIPTDNNTYNELIQLNVSLEDLTQFSLKFTYS